MALLKKYISKNTVLFKVWFWTLVIKFSFCFVLLIIAVSTQPISNSWLFEFLTLTKGLRNNAGIDPFILALIWTPIHAIINSIEFAYAYFLFQYTFLIENYENKEIMNKLRRKIKIIMVGSIVTFFAQILYVLLWLIISTGIMIVKYSYHKEIKSLRNKKISFNIDETAKAIKESLAEYKV